MPVRVVPRRAGADLTLSEASRIVSLAPAIAEMRGRFLAASPLFASSRLWLINSTSAGGGVAELLPTFVDILTQLGVNVTWLVMEPRAEDAASFFALTKQLHNNLHGEGKPLGEWAVEHFASSSSGPQGAGEASAPGADTAPAVDGAAGGVDTAAALSKARALYERVSAECAADVALLCPHPDASRDIWLIHDPQPAGMARALLRAAPRQLAVWRCHIGSDVKNASTASAWEFLSPHLEPYSLCVFSAKEYVPAALARRTMVLTPGVAPTSAKNKELGVYELSQILLRAGASGKSSSATPIHAPFKHRVVIHTAPPLSQPLAECPSSCACGSSRQCAGSSGGGVPFFSRPVITQISRFDRLKGFSQLLRGFVHLKLSAAFFAQQTASGAASSEGHDAARHERVLRSAVLVLAGPSPESVSDDPQGRTVLLELLAEHAALPASVAADVFILELPMQCAAENALIVNAIQRASLVIAQCSLREGFGLTAAEAMLKRVCVVGTAAAVGLRAQITHMRDGVLVQGAVEDPAAVACALNTALGNDALRDACAANGQARVYSRGLVYESMTAWLDVFHAHVAHREREVQLAFGGDEAPTCGEPLNGLAGGGASGWPSAATPW